MSHDYSSGELLEFLSHAADKGLMPAATARALAVASRSVLDILSEEERTDLRRLDVAAVVKRFGTKRARDFNPTSLKEYGRRFERAIDLFIRWRDDPAGFTVPTRVTSPARAKAARPVSEIVATPKPASLMVPPGGGPQGTGSPVGPGYQSSFPVRAGVVVTISNVPSDLTKAEAERLAHFVRLLSLE